MSILRRVNWLFISGCAAAIETSACVWSFTLLPLIPLVCPAAMVTVQFISSGLLQLVALPVLAVSGKIQADRLAVQSKEQHDATMVILEEVRRIGAETHAAAVEIHQIHKAMKEKSP
jgi:hypothetical protein